MRTIITLFFLFIQLNIVHAQMGKIAGVVTDAKTGETLIGANVLIEGLTGVGGQTDLDGKFIIEDVKEGVYTLVVSYISYQTKKISEVKVEAGNTANVNIALLSDIKDIEPIVITATMKKENINSLLIIQKNNVTISDGIAQETLKKTGDRSTADALRRVSGISVQDNKFVVIRGLGDRYNYALLNGIALPSSEADRRSFSFDIIPSNLIDNIIINKAATPDMPAEFSGGIIQVNTKDIPENFTLNAAVGTGINSVTTFKDFDKQLKSKTDWLGYDTDLRALPTTLPNTDAYLRLKEKDKLVESKKFSNDWAYDESTAPLNYSVQLSAGGMVKIKKVKWGTVGAITYNKSYRANAIKRSQYELDDVVVFDYEDKSNRENVLLGAMLNTSVQLSPLSKITLRNMLNINTESSVVSRTGPNYDNEQLRNATTQSYNSNRLITSQLAGEHFIAAPKLKIKWNAALSNINRAVPNQRTLTYLINTNDVEDTIYTALIPLGSASPQFTGKFYSTLQQTDRNVLVDISRRVKGGVINAEFKIGGFYFDKNRTFASRLFGPVFNMKSNGTYMYQIADLPSDKLFNSNNIIDGGIMYDEITLPQDAYTSSSVNAGGYAMVDMMLGTKLKIATGARFETFTQILKTKVSVAEVAIEKSFPKLLPSLNATYLLNDKINLRFAYGQTISRPEFRELAPFGYYDFGTSSVVIGSEQLTPGIIHNIDLRFEQYPGEGQLFSASLFYKYFKNPIEQIFFSTGAGSQTRSYRNAQYALNYGVEIECRRRLGFIADKAWLNNLTLSVNAAYIFSKVAFEEVKAATSVRPLQSQSPYLVNAMLDYTTQNKGFSTALMFNIIGNRLTEVGNYSFPDIYEKHRPLLDFMITKKIVKNFDIRLLISDIFAQDIIFYQDYNKDKKFDKVQDNIITQFNNGRTFTTTLSYKF
jgi:outer membrane receptor protein involved in Fe transport